MLSRAPGRVKKPAGAAPGIVNDWPGAYTAAASEMEKTENILSRATSLLPRTGIASTRWFILTGVASALLGSAALAPAESMHAADVLKGKELFLRYCSGCHGEDGRGEAKTFQPN